MDTQDTTTRQDKQITIDVPEDRVAEFYAFYSRFLAFGSGPRRRGRHGPGGAHRGGGHGGRHRCGGRGDLPWEQASPERGEASPPETSTTGDESVS